MHLPSKSPNLSGVAEGHTGKFDLYSYLIVGGIWEIFKSYFFKTTLQNRRIVPTRLAQIGTKNINLQLKILHS